MHNIYSHNDLGTFVIILHTTYKDITILPGVIKFYILYLSDLAMSSS